MYLQRIELQGFKSFAGKTVLEFPAPGKIKPLDKQTKETRGITSIVGPNGSGKSNVVDAVRWVLGEQSLKLLRGKKATDVIFAGSAKKAQMGMAEVSLYLNNEDGAAPIDYSEIVITRKLYRDGNSEYLLNKSQVRLFDIVMLLAKTNFGQNTYSVIGQGMIDRIVNYSAQERKEFFDEATGVKQFQIKREKSVNKLKRSRENIAQVRVLLQELEPHLKSLTRQVSRLHKRQEIEVELREVQVNYFGKLWLDLDDAYQKYALAHNTQENQKLGLEKNIEILQEKLEKLSLDSNRTEDYDKLQQEHNTLSSAKNDLAKELAIIRGKLELEYSKVGKQNLSWLENKKEELDKRISEINFILDSQKPKLHFKREELVEQEKAIHILNNELAVLQNNLQTIQEDLYSVKGGERSNFFLDSVRAVLSQKNRIPGIYGTVGDVGSIDKKYEEALATAAGSRLWAVIVESDEVAVQCIKYLKENRLASVTFFPLNKLREYPVDQSSVAVAEGAGAVGFAIDLVSFDAKFMRVFQQVFGSTIVVETIDDAKNIGIGRERMVTLDGDTFEKSGIMKGGYKKKGLAQWLGVGQNKFVSQEEKVRNITSLKNTIDDKYRQREIILSKINDLKVDLRLEEDRGKSLAEEVNLINREKSKIVEELKEGQMSPKDQDQFLRDLNVKKSEKESLLEKITAKEDKIRLKINEFNFKEEKKKKEIFGIQQDIHTQQVDLNGVTAALNEVRVELAKIETKKEDLFANMRRELGDDYRPKSDKIKADEIDTNDCEIKISRLKKQLELIGGTDPEVEKEYEDVKGRFEFLTQQGDDTESAIKDLEKVVEELDKLIKKQFESEFKKINEDFSRYFKQLFDGGSAKLVLVQKEVTEAEAAREEVANNLPLPEGETPLTAEGVGEESLVAEREEKKELFVEDKSFLSNMGIDIEACPPGKKIKNINVLSGGEKTMTALALICAIIANNPSPFILFDEVDAALDEANSTKLSNIVEELAHKTQFIIITHNRAIMARANVLYGVTMQGDGISRLISLHLDEAEKMTSEK